MPQGRVNLHAAGLREGAGRVSCPRAAPSVRVGHQPIRPFPARAQAGSFPIPNLGYLPSALSVNVTGASRPPSRRRRKSR